MKAKTKKKNDIWIVEIDGPIKSGMEFELADELETCLHNSEVPKIIVDMKKVPFINSAALGIFLNIFREIEKKNGRFALCSISPDVDNLLEITKLGSVLEIFKNQDDALDSMTD
ncbi:MAG: anti-sigma factor antagonist [Candidatus Hydrogenedentota bacterium]|nr:MAG: anti-sigma factor antagonist [Candidatus Hydrogenedentota bacterium]